MSALDVAIIIGAAFRLTRLVVDDSVPEADGTGGLPPLVAARRWLVKRTGAISSWVDLASCYWCAGWWCSLIVLGMFHVVPATRPLLAALALSSVVGIIARET